MLTEAGFKGTGPIALVIRRVEARRTMALSMCLGFLGALLVLALTPVSAAAVECTDTWTGPAEGPWVTAANWSAGHAPTESDVACIGSGKTVNVTTGTNKAGVVQGEGKLAISGGTLELLNSTSSSSIANLKMTGGILTGPATLGISGSLTIEKSSTMSGTGSTVVQSTASASLSNKLKLTKRRLVNEGSSFSLLTSGTIEGTESPEILNTGTFILNGAGVSGATFVNQGTVRKIGTATNGIGSSFENLGAVRVEGGKFSISAGSSSSSSEWIVSEGAEITYGGTSYTMRGALSGSLSVTGGASVNLTMEGVSGSGRVEVSWYAKLTLSGSPTTVGTLAFGREGTNQAHGVLTGAGELKVSSSLQAAYESTMTGTGQTTILPGAKAAVTAKTTLTERKLVNEGTLTLSASGSVPTTEGGKLVNAGIVTRSGSGTNGFGLFENLGTVELSEGKLTFSTGSSTPSSQWHASGSAQLLFNAGTNYSMAGTVSGSVIVNGASNFLTLEGISGGEAELEVSRYGTVTVSGEPSTLGSLVFGHEGYNESHGKVTGSGQLKISKSLTAAFFARMEGSGSTVILPGATATLSQKVELAQRRIVNEGTFTQLTSGSIEGTESPEILNTGTFILNGGGVGGAKFINEATVRKIGSSTNGIGSTFENLDTVEVQGGVLSFSGGSSSSSSEWLASEGGKFRFTSSSSSTYSLAGTVSGPVELERASTTVVVEGVKASGATFEVTDYARLTASGSPTTVGSLVFGREGYNEGRGEVNGAGELRIVNSLTAPYINRWNGTGTTRLLPGASGNISSLGQMSERHLINEGTLTLSENGWLELSGKAEVINTGTFFANTSASSAVGGSESLKSSFVNEGAVKKSVGTNTTSIVPPFINSGSIREESGHISIPNPITLPASNKTDNHSQCGDPVDCGTGNFSESQTDYEIGGRGVGLNLIRTYSAKAAATATSPGAFGYGWMSSFSDRLAIEEGGAKVTLTQSDGGTVPFTESGKGSYIAPVWSQDVLSGSIEAGYTLTLPEQTKHKFSGSGRLESVVDRNGNETTLSYDEAGRLKEITDPSGRKITLGYNGEGLVESAKDPIGNVVKYAYESKNLKTVTLPGEASPNWEFKYDASHRMTSMTDGRGGKTSNEYDSSSRVVSQTEPSGQTLTFKYEAFHTTITNKANGAVTDEWFTSNNQPYSITRGFGTASATTETFTYNIAGQLTSATDGNGHVTTYGYDAAGNRTSEKDAAGNKKEWTYNETHDVLTETTPAKETTTFKRDANGNVESISRPGPGETIQTTTLIHDGNGQLESVTSPLKRTWSYTYDSYGDRTSETNPVGDTQTFNYDKDSRLVSLVTPRGTLEGAEPSEYEATIERDTQGRPKKIIDPLGHATEYTYDVNGNLVSTTDANSHVTKYVYNAANQQIKLEKPNGATIETGYDKAGQVTSQVDANKHTTTYVRNVLEQPVEVIDPLSRKTVSEFDDAGNLIAVTDPAERKISYTYNPANHLVEASYSEEATPSVSFEYDADGNVISMVDGTGESRFVYDQLGRLTESEDGHGDIVGYGYDLANGLTGIRYPNGKEVTREFDPAGRLESVTDWLGKTTTFAYDADSNLEGIVFPAASGNVDEYSYDRADQLNEAKFTRGVETLASLSYGRDKVGLIEEEAKEGLPGPEEVAYGYDKNNRLIEAGEASFEYDPADNLTKGLGSTNTYDVASQLESGTGVSYTYDKNSERTKVTPSSGPATSYGYNQAGSLTSVERPEEGEVPAVDESFAYDGSGLMVSRTSGLSSYFLTWDSSSSLPLLLDDGQNSYLYGPGGLAVEQISSAGAPTYLHHDQLSSTRLLTNAEGEITGTFTYGPYGAPEGSTGASTTLLGFAGQYTDPETGLQYLRARFYDPSTGQFISRDPLAALTRAPFGYANSNPVNSADPTGLGPCILGFISCDESDDPCDSPITTNILMPLCLVPEDATETVTNASAGIGDSILSPVPFVELPISGPSARDFLGINNVNECSFIYTAGNLAGELISFGKGVRGIAKHTPGIWRDASRHLNEKIVHLPPEISP